MRSVKQNFALNLLLLGMFMLITACAQQETRSEEGEEVAKQKPKCTVIERTGRRTGLRVCERS